MAKNSILDYDTTPDNNTDMGGISIQGTATVNNFDNAFRTIMSQIADFTGGSTIASGTTTDLSTVKGQYVTVSGTSTITSFGTAKAGWMKYLRFSGAATITYNATSMILPGAANISTQAGDFALFVSEGSGNWRCLEYSRAAVLTRPTQRGQLYGLTLSNNVTDATNDIDIAAGDCASDDAIPSLMTLASSLTKRLDAAWAVGTGNGGLDTGSIANTTYHVWLIQRSDTGVVDALFSVSATSPTMPSGYDRKRRIGSIVRAGGSILGFVQNGDEFTFTTIQANSTITNPGTAGNLIATKVPTGIKTKGKFAFGASAASGSLDSPIYIRVSDPATTDSPATTSNFNFILFLNSGIQIVIGGELEVFTDTSAQVRVRLSASAGGTVYYLQTIGWTDTRGRS